MAATVLSVPIPHAILSHLEVEETPQAALSAALSAFESRSRPFASLPPAPPCPSRESRKIGLSVSLAERLLAVAEHAPQAHKDADTLARRLLSWYAVPPAAQVRKNRKP